MRRLIYLCAAFERGLWAFCGNTLFKDQTIKRYNNKLSGVFRHLLLRIAGWESAAGNL
jgi:hypothetical protein